MASTESGSRKRKACLPCIRAKAKCSTSEERPDECYRCTRLNKQCVFEVVAKKPGPGPKSRSRVRQLEQRVENLIDLIAAQKSGTTAADVPVANGHQTTSATQIVTPDSTATDETSNGPETPIPSKYHVESSPFTPFDPIEAGVLDADHAFRLVDEFKTCMVPEFPFVIVDSDTEILRRQQPFLFHAILTVSSYGTPPIQHLLEDELKKQLARIIEYSRKSLEILQGLLVYAAWYHAFYRPVNQQLAVIIQICVAFVQDLGISKRTKQQPGKWSIADCAIVGRPRGTIAEKRAYLGTFFVNVLFAQAWRKRTTLPYTRYMAQCTEVFVDSTVATDALIRPIIQGSALLARVNEFFSFDDIDNSEIRGETMLSISTTNFLGELQCIKDSVPAKSLEGSNTNLILLFCLIDIGINEVSLHVLLWQSARHKIAMPPSVIRLRMLSKTMNAAKTYVNNLLDRPQSHLYHLGISSWAGWFYTVIVICKLVFLTENERLGQSDLENIPEELDNLIPENVDQVIASSANERSQVSDETNWNALSVEREYNIQQLFEQFMDKLRFTLPVGVGPWALPREQSDSLLSIGSIQQTMLSGFRKRMDQLRYGTATNSVGYHLGTALQSAPPTTTAGSVAAWHNQQLTPCGVYAAGPAALPFAGFMNFDSINFEGIDLPASSNYAPQVGQELLGDWMWDMIMDDFTIPSI